MRKLSKVLAVLSAAAMITAVSATTAFAGYNVAGAEGLTGANWDPAQNEMTDNGDGTYSLTFENIAAGTYEFKIATDGAWDNGEYNLEGDASSGGANASVTVDVDGSTVIVTFDGEKASVEVKAPGAAETPETPEAPEAPETGDSSTLGFILAAMTTAAGVAFVASKRVKE